MQNISRRRFTALIATAPFAGAAALSTGMLEASGAQTLSAGRREAVEHVLRRLVQSGSVPGVSYSIGNARETIAEGAFGLRSITPPRAMQRTTSCALASVSKQFAAAAIFMLDERAKVSLHAPVATYVPDYRYGRQMTLAQLLTMRAGVTIDDAACEAPIGGKIDDTTLLAKLNRRGLDFPPGRHFAYTNCGYDLVGLIVARVSGMPYARFIDTNIFRPLGMTSSYVLGTRADGNFAEGYARERGRWKKENATRADIAFASGNLASTAGDMQRWNRSLLSATLVSRASLRRMFTVPSTGSSAHMHYASGWFVEPSGLIWHGGTLAGYGTANLLVPHRGYGITLLANAVRNERWQPEETARDIYNAAGLEPKLPPFKPRVRSTRPA